MTIRRLQQMIAADLLKLRKKRSVAGWALVLTAGISIVFYAYWHNTGDQTGTSPNMIPMTNNNLSV